MPEMDIKEKQIRQIYRLSRILLFLFLEEILQCYLKGLTTQPVIGFCLRTLNFLLEPLCNLSRIAYVIESGVNPCSLSFAYRSTVSAVLPALSRQSRRMLYVTIFGQHP
uniref:Uncharacterized protein n=1 Tax=Cucumis sativus TaxID=3659 RepID=A0A0A0K5C6_CUCSA